MAKFEVARKGSPCWADLWTSDVVRAKSFYEALFGWEALGPDPDMGGYVLFLRDGMPVAGAMGQSVDGAGADSWKLYLSTDDAERTLTAAKDAGALAVLGPDSVSDLGVQGILVDPWGAVVGVWQPREFDGFGVLGEPGSPAWFELRAPDLDGAVDFYRSIFGWETHSTPGPQGRYTTVVDPSSGEDTAGVRELGPDAQGRPSSWLIYWSVSDMGEAIGRLGELGGSLEQGPHDTPWGSLALASDPMGALVLLWD